MKDPWLLPFLLPNVFEIAKTQTKEEFNAATLPALQPLFALTDPPQNMLSKSNTISLPLISRNDLQADHFARSLISPKSSPRQPSSLHREDLVDRLPRTRHASHLQLARLGTSGGAGTRAQDGAELVGRAGRGQYPRGFVR